VTSLGDSVRVALGALGLTTHHGVAHVAQRRSIGPRSLSSLNVANVQRSANVEPHLRHRTPHTRADRTQKSKLKSSRIELARGDMSHRGEPPLEKQGSCSCPERMALAVPYIPACAMLCWRGSCGASHGRNGKYVERIISCASFRRVLHSLPELASLRTLRCRNRHAAHGLDRGCS
jgi:hypothetical protein